MQQQQGLPLPPQPASSVAEGEKLPLLVLTSTPACADSGMGQPWQRPAKFRPAGAPAGAWPHTAWYICTFYDPYERINVWSHGIPGIGFVILGMLAKAGVAPGGSALSVYCFCAAMTHLSSAITHVWPDDHVLEKIDHLCIPFLIVGTPLTAVMAMRPEGPYTALWAVTVGLVASAFMRPLPRVIGFIACGASIVFFYAYILNLNLLLQVVLHLAGAISFIRNGGHEGRPLGLQDHHILHYCVTSACLLHVANIMQLVAAHDHKKLP